MIIVSSNLATQNRQNADPNRTAYEERAAIKGLPAARKNLSVWFATT
jgi:hypothetical protein